MSMLATIFGRSEQAPTFDGVVVPADKLISLNFSTYGLITDSVRRQGIEDFDNYARRHQSQDNLNLSLYDKDESPSENQTSFLLPDFDSAMLRATFTILDMDISAKYSVSQKVPSCEAPVLYYLGDHHLLSAINRFEVAKIQLDSNKSVTLDLSGRERDVVVLESNLRRSEIKVYKIKTPYITGEMALKGLFILP
jgi:hypothetical protein